MVHELDVGVELLGEVGEFVHEADAGGEHGVGGVLGELRAPDVHEDDALVVPLEGGVELVHESPRAGVLDADDDAVGLHEVFNGDAFLEEFGVGDDAVVDGRPPLALSSSAMAARTLSAVPTGTVDLSTTL